MAYDPNRPNGSTIADNAQNLSHLAANSHGVDRGRDDAK